MEQDHQKKVEMLRLDHLREINNIRQKYMDEVGICNWMREKGIRDPES